MNYIALVYSALALVIIIFGYIFGDAVQLRRLRRKYDENKDESRKGEQLRATRKRESGTKRSDQSERGELLQATVIKPVRKNSSSSRVRSRLRRRR